MNPLSPFTHTKAFEGGKSSTLGFQAIYVRWPAGLQQQIQWDATKLARRNDKKVL